MRPPDHAGLVVQTYRDFTSPLLAEVTGDYDAHKKHGNRT